MHNQLHFIFLLRYNVLSYTLEFACFKKYSFTAETKKKKNIVELILGVSTLICQVFKKGENQIFFLKKKAPFL